MRNRILLLGNVSLVLALGCSDDAAGGGLGGDSSSGGAGGEGASGSGGAPAGGNGDEGGSNNPPNPRGLGPAPIELGEAGDLAAAGGYVLLAKTGITNVTGSAITGGHVGLSPAAASFITGFSLIADSSNTFSTSSSVLSPGRVYSSDYAPPTPINLTTAVLDMEAAYSDGAGRSDPDFLNLGSGEIGGETLAPGLYRWGSAVTIPDDVTIAGGEEDTWIFQISDDLDLSTAKQIILSGNARAANVFWVVAGQVTIHADAHFEGIILSQTAVTLQTNASMNGRALAQSLIAIDDNAITAP
jgi:hypothetical protein